MYPRSKAGADAQTLVPLSKLIPPCLKKPINFLLNTSIGSITVSKADSKNHQNKEQRES